MSASTAAAKLDSRHYGKNESKVNPFTLSFGNSALESSYREYVRERTAKRAQWAGRAFLSCLLVLSALEVAFSYSGDLGSASQRDVGIIRLATAAIYPLFSVVFSRANTLYSSLEVLIALTFSLHGALIVLAGFIGTFHGAPFLYPYMWWSSSFDMMHCAITQMSGVRFPIAAGIAFVHPLAVMINYLARVGEIDVYNGLDQFGLLYVCIFCCLLVAYRREHIERKEFVAFLNTSFDKRMREKLLNEMLPQKIKDALQYGGDIIEEQADGNNARRKDNVVDSGGGGNRSGGGRGETSFDHDQQQQRRTSANSDEHHHQSSVNSVTTRSTSFTASNYNNDKEGGGSKGGGNNIVVSSSSSSSPSSETTTRRVSRLSDGGVYDTSLDRVNGFLSSSSSSSNSNDSGSPRQSSIANGGRRDSQSPQGRQRQTNDIDDSSFVVPAVSSIAGLRQPITPLLTPLTTNTGGGDLLVGGSGGGGVDFSGRGMMHGGIIDLSQQHYPQQQQQQQHQPRTRSIHFPKRSSVSLPHGLQSTGSSNSNSPATGGGSSSGLNTSSSSLYNDAQVMASRSQIHSTASNGILATAANAEAAAAAAAVAAGEFNSTTPISVSAGGAGGDSFRVSSQPRITIRSGSNSNRTISSPETPIAVTASGLSQSVLLASSSSSSSSEPNQHHHQRNDRRRSSNSTSNAAAFIDNNITSSSSSSLSSSPNIRFDNTDNSGDDGVNLPGAVLRSPRLSPSSLPPQLATAGSMRFAGIRQGRAGEWRQMRGSFAAPDPDSHPLGVAVTTLADEWRRGEKGRIGMTSRDSAVLAREGIATGIDVISDDGDGGDDDGDDDEGHNHVNKGGGETSNVDYDNGSVQDPRNVPYSDRHPVDGSSTHEQQLNNRSIPPPPLLLPPPQQQQQRGGALIPNFNSKTSKRPSSKKTLTVAKNDAIARSLQPRSASTTAEASLVDVSGGGGVGGGGEEDGAMDEAIGHYFPNVTVMFVYISDLPLLASHADPLELIMLLNGLYTDFDEVLSRTGVYKIMAVANMYLCVSGALDENENHAVTMARTALEILKVAKRRRAQGLRIAGRPVCVQIGLHSGEVAGGVIGTKTFNWHIFGDTVNTASRFCSASLPGKIQISPTLAEVLRAENNHLMMMTTTMTSEGGKNGTSRRDIVVSGDDAVRSGGAEEIVAQGRRRSSYYGCAGRGGGGGVEGELFFILRERGSTWFKGKGLISTYWLADEELDIIDGLEAIADEREAAVKARMRRQRLFATTLPTSVQNHHDTSSSSSGDGSSNSSIINRLGGSSSMSSSSSLSISTADDPDGVASQRSASLSGGGGSGGGRGGGGKFSHWGAVASASTNSANPTSSSSSLSSSSLSSLQQKQQQVQSFSMDRMAVVAVEAMRRRSEGVFSLTIEQPPHNGSGRGVGSSASVRSVSSSSSSPSSTLHQGDDSFKETAVEKTDTMRNSNNSSFSDSVVVVQSPRSSSSTAAAAATTTTADDDESGCRISSSSSSSSSTNVASTTNGQDSPRQQQQRNDELNAAQQELESRHAGLVKFKSSSDRKMVEGKNGASAIVTIAAGGGGGGNSINRIDPLSLSPLTIAGVGGGERGSKNDGAEEHHLVRLREEPLVGWLSPVFAKQSLEAKFMRVSMLEVRFQVTRAYMLAFFIALGALARVALDPSSKLFVPGVLISRSYLSLTALVMLSIMLSSNNGGPASSSSSSSSSSSLCGIGSILCVRLFPCLRCGCGVSRGEEGRRRRGLQLHEVLSAFLCLTSIATLNEELFDPNLVNSRNVTGLANLNFVLIVVFSFLEMRVALLVLVNAISLATYTFLLSRDYTLFEVVAHSVLVSVAVLLSSLSAYTREKSRRNRFVIQEHATRQRNKCERLLLNMLPSLEHAEKLMRAENVVEVLDDVTLLYSDVKGFTELCQKISPEELIKFLDKLYSAYDKHLDHAGLYKIETIGDAFIVVGGMNRSGIGGGARRGQNVASAVMGSSGGGEVSKSHSGGQKMTMMTANGSASHSGSFSSRGVKLIGDKEERQGTTMMMMADASVTADSLTSSSSRDISKSQLGKDVHQQQTSTRNHQKRLALEPSLSSSSSSSSSSTGLSQRGRRGQVERGGGEEGEDGYIDNDNSFHRRHRRRSSVATMMTPAEMLGSVVSGPSSTLPLSFSSRGGLPQSKSIKSLMEGGGGGGGGEEAFKTPKSKSNGSLTDNTLEVYREGGGGSSTDSGVSGGGGGGGGDLLKSPPLSLMTGFEALNSATKKNAAAVAGFFNSVLFQKPPAYGGSSSSSMISEGADTDTDRDLLSEDGSGDDGDGSGSGSSSKGSASSSSTTKVFAFGSPAKVAPSHNTCDVVDSSKEEEEEASIAKGGGGDPGGVSGGLHQRVAVHHVNGSTVLSDEKSLQFVNGSTVLSDEKSFKSLQQELDVDNKKKTMVSEKLSRGAVSPPRDRSEHRSSTLSIQSTSEPGSSGASTIVMSAGRGSIGSESNGSTGRLSVYGGAGGGSVSTSRNSPLSEPSSSRHASTTGTEGSSIAGAAAIASSLSMTQAAERRRSSNFTAGGGGGGRTKRSSVELPMESIAETEASVGSNAILSATVDVPIYNVELEEGGVGRDITPSGGRIKPARNLGDNSLPVDSGMMSSLTLERNLGENSLPVDSGMMSSLPMPTINRVMGGGLVPPALPPPPLKMQPLSSTGATVAFALDMLVETRKIREETGLPVHIRIGIHTGKVIGGVIGTTRPRYLIWGEDTLIGNKMESTGIVGGIQVSEMAALRLQQEGFEFVPHQVVDVSYKGDDNAVRALGNKWQGEEEMEGGGGGGVGGEGEGGGGGRELVNTYRLVSFTDAAGDVFRVDELS